MSSDPENYKDDCFFNIFTFDHTMHDAFDGGIMYGIVKVTKDIPELGLKADTEYEQVNFVFQDLKDGPHLHFINWLPREQADSKGIIHPDPQRSVLIKLSDIAPHCKW